MAQSIEAPEEKKARSFSKRDWASVAEYIMQEFKRRKRERSDVEGKWSEVDRQLSMTPDAPLPTDPAWLPNLELAWQSQTHEAITADCRRLIFPSDREWFSAKASIPKADDLRRLNYDKFIDRKPNDPPGKTSSTVPVSQAIAAKGQQKFADNLAVAFLQKFHALYDFRSAIDALNGEATKYGCFVGQVKWVTDEVVNEDFSGGRPSKYPALVPCSMWNTFLDDSPAKLFAEGIHVGPGIIRTYHMRVADLRLAAKRGATSVTDQQGGWRREAVAVVDENLGDSTKDTVQIVRFDGDLVVPRSGKQSIYLPNVIVDVCDQGPVVVRYRERDMPFNPYIVGYYHRDDIRKPYASSPMIKGVPLQKVAGRAYSEWLACAALHARPPTRYNPYDPHFTKSGGPELVPGAKWAANTNPDVIKVGDPQAIWLAINDLWSQYQQETGVTAVRLGQQTKSHQTAFAIDREDSRGLTRTVDYVSSNLYGALRTFLYMEYELAKEVGEQTIFMPEYDGFVVASGKNLPPMVEIKVAGAGAAIDERQRKNDELAALQALLATAPAAKQAGGQLPDINAVQKAILRLGGITDNAEFFPEATAAGVGGVPAGVAFGPGLPGIDAVLPGSP